MGRPVNFEKALDRCNVSRETMPALESIVSDALKWQSKTNLVSNTTLPDFWNRHILDSLQLWPLLPDTDFKLYDLGSGGGFPCLPLAACMSVTKIGSATAVESNHKKTSFLRRASSNAKIAERIDIVAERIEVASQRLAAPDVITARALAPLVKLLDWTTPWTSARPDIRLLFHKGREYRDELATCAAHWQFDLIEHESVVDPESRILELTHVKQLQA
jgi:16S rRNA (guanine527-N7)-methyltransferase